MSKIVAVVTYLPTGEMFVVPAFGSRPSHSARVAAALHGRGTRIGSGEFVPCDGCSRFVASGDGSVTVNGRAVVVAALQADRACNDLPAFAVTRPVAYHPATVIVTCPSCNGSPARRAVWSSWLESAALARLREYAPSRTY
jgi:hypothetical protein